MPLSFYLLYSGEDVSKVFEYSTAFKANLTGLITFLAGYLHDGGTQTSSRMVNVYICNCTARYDETPGYVEDNMGMEMMHISSISACENVGVLCVGNDLEITAHYDTQKYMPMMNADGTLVLSIILS